METTQPDLDTTIGLILCVNILLRSNPFNDRDAAGGEGNRAYDFRLLEPGK